MYLAGDVGGTKILLEVGEMRSGRWETVLQKRYSSADVTSFPEVLHEFLAERDPAHPDGHGIDAAVFGVAGPVTGNEAKMTNRPWDVDGDLLARRFGIPRVRVVNDLAAAAHGIDGLDAGELVEIQPGKAVPDGPRVVMGVGTGLGIAYCVVVDGKPREIPGEGGHRNFGPATLEQAVLWQSLFETHGRVSEEHVLSGPGFRHVQVLKSGQPPEVALDLFASCLGSVAGDHALAVLARGGVYLMGGVVMNMIPSLKTSHFRSAFCAKGAHSAMLMSIPVHAVKSERVAVIGAARFAAEE